MLGVIKILFLSLYVTLFSYSAHATLKNGVQRKDGDPHLEDGDFQEKMGIPILKMGIFQKRWGS